MAGPSRHIVSRALLAVSLALCSCGAWGEGVPVFIGSIELATTHDWPLETPQVYFLCDGEEKRYLTGVAQAHRAYNFTTNESFQPLTQLEVPKCKRCGLYEEDFFTKDDTFDTFELCPLDFSEPPEGKLVWRAPKEVNITFVCAGCNTRNSFAGGVVLSNPTQGGSHFLAIFGIAMGSALGVSIGVAWAIFCFKERGWLFHRPSTDDAKFMELFDQDEEDEFLDDDDLDADIEMAQKRDGV